MNKKELLDELKKEGFSKKILEAFDKVKREDFVPYNLKEYAYENMPLSIGYGATISQPYTIAFMLELLELKDNLKILEIGSGSGYVLALINEISKNSEIIGIERIKALVERSKNILKDKKNIKIIYGDCNKDLNKKDKYDRILVSAAFSKIPENLIEKLNEEGILVTPVLDSIFKIKKTNSKIIKEEYPGFIFVPIKEGKE